MDNECLYLCSTASTLSMGALKCTTHLLPLLCFIINACNKCVTSDLVVFIGNDDLSLFSNSSATPLFISSSIGRGKNKIVHRFVFSVRRIYCKLIFCMPHDMCMIKMSSSC